MAFLLTPALSCSQATSYAVRQASLATSRNQLDATTFRNKGGPATHHNQATPAPVTSRIQGAPTTSRNQATPATSHNQVAPASRIHVGPVTSRISDAPAISCNQTVAAISNNQTEAARLRNQNIAASQSHTSTTTSHRPATAFANSTMSHHDHDRVEPSGQLVRNLSNDTNSGTASHIHVALSPAISRIRDPPATSHNRSVAAISHNQTEVARSHNQNTAASQSHTSTTTSHRPAAAFANSAASHHNHDRVEPSGPLVRNLSDDTDSGNESDKESETDNNPIPPQARAKRNSRKSHHNPHPNHLGFYSGTWHDVLVEAKFKYRLFIHTENPFPERNTNSLRDAHDCLLEIITKYQDDGILLDEGTVNQLLTYYFY